MFFLLSEESSGRTLVRARAESRLPFGYVATMYYRECDDSDDFVWGGNITFESIFPTRRLFNPEDCKSLAKLKEHFADESIYPLALHFHWTLEEDNKLVKISGWVYFWNKIEIIFQRFCRPSYCRKHLKLHVEVIGGPTDRLSGVDAGDNHKWTPKKEI